MRLRRALDAKRARRSKPLRDGRVAPVTRQRYDQARLDLRKFLDEQQLRPKIAREVDDGVALYIESLCLAGGFAPAANIVLAAVPLVSLWLPAKLEQSWRLQKNQLKLVPDVPPGQCRQCSPSRPSGPLLVEPAAGGCLARRRLRGPTGQRRDVAAEAAGHP